jgi:hypothetical protein
MLEQFSIYSNLNPVVCMFFYFCPFWKICCVYYIFNLHNIYGNVQVVFKNFVFTHFISDKLLTSPMDCVYFLIKTRNTRFKDWQFLQHLFNIFFIIFESWKINVKLMECWNFAGKNQPNQTLLISAHMS